MNRQYKKISLSMISSCLIFTNSYGSTPCQNGFSYDNKCDPYYNINLIEAKVPGTRHIASKNSSTNNVITYSNKSSNSSINTSTQYPKNEDLSYLDSLRRKYSNQFNGRMGLQTLIDRSAYLSLKKLDKEQKKELKENTENVKVSNNNIIKKKVEKTSKEELANKNIQPEKIVKAKTKIKLVDLNKSKPNKKIQFYTIKKGDSLIKISKKFGLKVTNIIQANKLDKNKTIKVGEKIKIPLVNENNKLAQLKKSKKTSKPKIAKSNKDIYIVKKGDTLIKIAKKLNISITKLREYNKLSRSSQIKIGQKISLKENKNIIKNKTYDIVKNIKLQKVPSLKYKRKINVVATAYTSHRNQTDKTPFLAAWNNRIRPGMKIIAVSPDLIRKYGLTNGIKVKILGLPGYYVVRDKMNKRLHNHIDIYMGINKRRALNWGRRRITLYW